MPVTTVLPAAPRGSEPEDRGTVRYVKVSLLKCSDLIHRTLNWRWIEAKKPVFRWAAIGVLEVDQLPNGDLYIADGQHRAELVKLVLGENALVHAHITQIQSLQEQAERFLDLDARTPQPAQKKFAVRTVNRDPAALEIVRILKGAGLIVKTAMNSEPRAWYEIAQPACVELIYRRRGAQGLAATARLIDRAWHGNKDATRADFIKGVSEFIHRYQACPAWDGAKVMNRLAKVAPAETLKQARALKSDCPNYSDIERIAFTLLKNYNACLLKPARLFNPKIEQSAPDA